MARTFFAGEELDMAATPTPQSLADGEECLNFFFYYSFSFFRGVVVVCEEEQ